MDIKPQSRKYPKFWYRAQAIERHNTRVHGASQTAEEIYSKLEAERDRRIAIRDGQLAEAR